MVAWLVAWMVAWLEVWSVAILALFVIWRQKTWKMWYRVRKSHWNGSNTREGGRCSVRFGWRAGDQMPFGVVVVCVGDVVRTVSARRVMCGEGVGGFGSGVLYRAPPCTHPSVHLPIQFYTNVSRTVLSHACRHREAASTQHACQQISHTVEAASGFGRATLERRVEKTYVCMSRGHPKEAYGACYAKRVESLGAAWVGLALVRRAQKG
eukprot:29859-Chlamydomonas_euryale.AAC.1